jgi:hypothetical protein
MGVIARSMRVRDVRAGGEMMPQQQHGSRAPRTAGGGLFRAGERLLSFGLATALVIVGTALPRRAAAQESDSPENADISDFTHDSASPATPPATPLPPTFRIVGVYIEAEGAANSAMQPDPDLRTVSILTFSMGSAACAAGVISFLFMKNLREDRDAAYDKLTLDPSTINESEARALDLKTHRAWVAGWAFLGSGVGLLAIGSIFAIAARVNGHRDASNEDSWTLNPPSLTAGAFSDGRTTALTVQMEW